MKTKTAGITTAVKSAAIVLAIVAFENAAACGAEESET